MQAVLIEPCRILRAYLIRAVLPFIKVILDFCAMPKIVANNKVHIGEIKCWETLYNFLGSRALLEDGNDRIKCHARSTHSHHTISIYL